MNVIENYLASCYDKCYFKKIRCFFITIQIAICDYFMFSFTYILSEVVIILVLKTSIQYNILILIGSVFIKVIAYMPRSAGPIFGKCYFHKLQVIHQFKLTCQDNLYQAS